MYLYLPEIEDRKMYYFRKKDINYLHLSYGEDIANAIKKMLDDKPNTWAWFQVDGKFLLVGNHD